VTLFVFYVRSFDIRCISNLMSNKVYAINYDTRSENLGLISKNPKDQARKENFSQGCFRINPELALLRYLDFQDFWDSQLKYFKIYFKLNLKINLLKFGSHFIQKKKSNVYSEGPGSHGRGLSPPRQKIIQFFGGFEGKNSKKF